ncbi:MAG: glycosyltransferase [Planctomycetota bacterium]
MGAGEAQRVLYERFVPAERTAFWYIDEGHIRGHRATGADVMDWCPARQGEPPLAEMLDAQRPDLFLGCLQRPDRSPAAWLNASDLDAIERHRGERGMQVAVRSGPSNMGDLFNAERIDFDRFHDAGVQSFYTQPERPHGPERSAIERGLIDVVRSPFHRECFGVAFRSFLDLGLSVIEEPHAADATRYEPIESADRAHDVLFVGNCWTFKWANMGPYIEALQDRFGGRFALFGERWPAGVRTRGRLEDAGGGDKNPFNRAVAASAVSVALHEPSQVLPWRFSGNERVFKLLLCGAAVVSDPNPILSDYLTPGDALELADGPEQMVRKVERLLDDPERRAAMGRVGREEVLRSHTYEVRARRLRDVLVARADRGQVFGAVEAEGFEMRRAS